jgi:hypothetical protein
MKKVFLIIAILAIGIFILSGFTKPNKDRKIKEKYLIGYWIPNIESSQLFFWKDKHGNMQVQEIADGDGIALEVLDFKINKTDVFIKTFFKNNNWTTESKYKLIDDNTLECTGINNEGNFTIIYTKVK